MDKKTTKQNEIIWKAAEYEYYHKDISWYWISFIISAILILIALWQKNFFFAVFVAIAEVAVILLSKRRPQIIEFKITDEGVTIGKDLFFYRDLDGFKIISRPHRLDEIILKKSTSFNPFLKIPIDSKLAEKAKVILQNYLAEIEYETPLIDTLTDWIGF